MACAKCGSPKAETYLNDGSHVCRICFYAADTLDKEHKAVKSAMTSGIVAVALSVFLLPIAIFGKGLTKGLFLVLLAPGIGAIRWAREKKRQLALKG